MLTGNERAATARVVPAEILFAEGVNLPHSEIPYIIRRTGGGLFSTVSSVLGHLRIASLLGLVPVVDFENYPTIYNERNPVNGTSNSWEYYFEPVSHIGVAEAYNSKTAVLSSEGHPANTVQSLSEDRTLLIEYMQFVRLRRETRDFVESSAQSLKISPSTLGIHFRGGEMRRARNHPYPPTLDQMIATVRAVMDGGFFSRILVVTEQEEYLRRLEREFGQTVIFTDSFRGRRRNPYKLSPRSNHRYLLGLEVLRDAYLLARCGGLISGSSNVTEMAKLLNNSQYLVDIDIRNGDNFRDPVRSYVSWYIRAALHRRWGGFSKEASVRH